MSDYETLHRQCISLRIDSALLDQLNTDETTISKALNTDISNTVKGLAVAAKEKGKKCLPADLP
jgi:hypothetical protein